MPVHELQTLEAGALNGPAPRGRAGSDLPVSELNHIDPASDWAGRAADITPAAQDPLGAARGIAFGVAIMVPVWGLIGSVAYRLFH